MSGNDPADEERVAELEANVAELEATVRGLVEELVDAKERLRLLERGVERGVRAGQDAVSNGDGVVQGRQTDPGRRADRERQDRDRTAGRTDEPTDDRVEAPKDGGAQESDSEEAGTDDIIVA